MTGSGVTPLGMGVDERRRAVSTTQPRPRTIGVLFIAATLASVLGLVLLGSTLDDPGYLTSAAAHETRVTIVALLDLTAAALIVAIAVMMFPVLNQHSARIALGYVVTRLVEATITVVGTIGLLSILTLSQEYEQTGGSNPSGFEPLGPVLLAVRDWTDAIGAQTAFALSALILNASLYQTRLVPRFISVWGLLGGALAAAAGLVGLFSGDPFSTISIVLILPIAVNEMALALWLIVRGFTTSTTSAVPGLQ